MARDERSFDEFTRARLPHLLMLGRTLTCDEQVAEALVEEALARVLDRWDESSPFTAEEEVRRSLVRAALRRTPAPAPSDDPVWRALASLGPRERAALALRLHEDLTDEQASDVLDCSPEAAREAADRASAGVDVEATRLAVLEPVPLDDTVMTEVRSRATRIRHRRSLVTAAVAVVAAVTLGLVVVATAGGSTVKGLEYPVMALQATSPDTVWAMTRDHDCPGCTVLWKGDGSGSWERVNTFRAAVLQGQLLMAPDGRNGFAWFASDHLQATHDGGKTWVVPDLDVGGSRLEIAIVGTTVYAQITGIDDSRLESSQLGSDDWAQVRLGATYDIGLLPFADELWVRDSSSAQDDAVLPLDRPDEGGRVPCPGGNVVSSPGALWISCRETEGQQVLRSTDGRTWTEFATVEDAAPALFPISDDRLLMRTFTGAVVVTEDGAKPVDLRLGQKDTIAAATFPDDKIGYVRSYSGVVLATDDGGRTWTEVS